MRTGRERHRARSSATHLLHLEPAGSCSRVAGGGRPAGWRSSSGAISPCWPVAAWLAFGVLVVVHARVLQRIERARERRARATSAASIGSTASGPAPGRDGARFSTGHPYARDLDLFGPGSLFQLLNTARTEAGEETLADWLRGPAAARRGPRPAGGGRRAAADARFPRGRRRAGAESPVGRTGRWRPGRRRRRRGLAPALARRAGRAARWSRSRLGGRWSYCERRRDRMCCSSGCSSRSAFAAIWRRPFHEVLHAHRHARARSRPARRPARARRARALHVAAAAGAARAAGDRRRAAVDAHRAAADAGVVARLDAQPAVRADCATCCWCASSWRWRSIAGTRAYGPAVGVAARGRRARGARGAGHLRLRASGRSVSDLVDERSGLRGRGARPSADCRRRRRAQRRAARRRRRRTC